LERGDVASVIANAEHYLARLGAPPQLAQMPRDLPLATAISSSPSIRATSCATSRSRTRGLADVVIFPGDVRVIDVAQLVARIEGDEEIAVAERKMRRI